MNSEAIEVVSAADAGWDAVEAVLVSDASARNCWCQFHVLENTEAKQTTRSSRRVLLKDQVENLDPPRGLVAHLGGQPVGWCGVEPRVRLRHVLASRLVTRSSRYPVDDPGVWAIYCILVPSARRRSGIGSLLLAAAVDHAQEHGAWAIEGYPIDTSKRSGVLPPGFSTGTLDMFERQGFYPIDSLPSARTLVSREL